MINKSFIAALSFVFALLLLTSACSRDEQAQSSPAATNMTDPASAAESPGSTPAETSSAEPEAQQGSDVAEEQKTAEETDDNPTAKTEAQTEAQTTTEIPASATQSGNAAPHEEQLALARKSGCLACHSVDKKLVGPAWRDVSARYKNDPNAKAKLIAKVSKGGSGNWTDVVGTAAMPPYSPRVSEQNITLLVEFVLSLEQ